MTDELSQVEIALLNIHDIYSSRAMIQNYMINFEHVPNKTREENAVAFVEEWEATHTKDSKDAGYWIQQGHEAWKARHLAGIAQNYPDLPDAKVVEIFEEN